MAKEKNQASEALETVYTFSNGFAKQADNMYGWLRHANLNPCWAPTIDGGMIIQLPASEVPCLRLMQKQNPARYGNAPAEISE